jgi:Flp pilus assembly protein TadD
VVTSGPPRVFPEDRCGPGSLALVLNALGDPASETELNAALPKVKGGVLFVDLLLAARRRGFEAALEAGSALVLRREIGEGRPAILLLRLLDAPGRKRDVFHYVVVDGFDPGRQLFRFQFGDGRARWAALGQIDGSWKAAGHALLRVWPKDASLDAALGQGVEMERQGRLEEAAALYARLAEEFPRSVRARVNLGNVEAARGRRAEAEAAYRAALRLRPSDRDALNNLAWLLLSGESRLEEAEGLAGRAAAEPGPDRPQALDTLGRIQLARGRCSEASRTFSEALDSEGDLPPELRAGLLEGLGRARRDCAETGAVRPP